LSRGGAVFAPGQLVLNPGFQGEFAVLRWTAPKSGHYLLSTKFVGICQKSQKTLADVYMLHGTKVMWNDSLNAPERPNEISTEKTIILNEKETIDFVVGASSAGAECRHTGVDVVVTEG
jgi:hypothetical protein